MYRPIALACIFFALPLSAANARPSAFNVRDYGAAGDAVSIDTESFQRAIAACADAGGGTVLVPAGTYLSGTIRLKSNVTLVLDDGARIFGVNDLDRYGEPSHFQDHWHRALVLGDGVENVAIVGRGMIDGKKVPDPNGEEHMRGPHAVLLANCRNVTLRDISVTDSGNYGILLLNTSHVDIRGLEVTGGWDGVHFRGSINDPCRDVSITNCQFYTGDDCIAGDYWQNTLIDRCVINSSCNGIRLIGPARDLIIHDCLIFGPGRNEHRTSREKHRRNMLAGLCLQPGAWDATQGAMDDVKISNVTIHDVTTPLFMTLKPGNIAGRITIDRLTATGAYLAPASIESWADDPIDHVTLRDSTLEFTGGGTTDDAAIPIKPANVDARRLPCWGLFARKVKTLDLVNVRMSVEKPDARPAVLAENVETLRLDTFKLPAGIRSPLTLENVGKVEQIDSVVLPSKSSVGN